MTSPKKPDDQRPHTDEQSDDTPREQQKSHGTQQNRSKREGHVTQIGSGQDQQSSRVGGRGPTRGKP